jgi:phage-related protein
MSIQRYKVREKMLWMIEILEFTGRIPVSYMKHIEGTKGLYEIRLQQGSDTFRVFCFFDQDNIIVFANGFLKKSKKTPIGEIEKALKIKQDYEREKQESDNIG